MILFPFRARARLTLPAVFSGVLVAASVFSPCAAEAQRRPDDVPREEREIRILRAPGGVTILRGASADRAVLGVTLEEPSRGDTAGIRLEAVEANGPAAKAGLKAGDIITDINGVSLKVAREDAEDLALAGLAQRRLQREMAKAKPGDDVRLQLRNGNGSRAVTVKTASAAELARANERVEERVITRSPNGRTMERTTMSRGVIGVNIGSAGTVRDTLGLFISSVVSGAAAERAGIVEGERIAAVNGVDVRIPREDVEDAQAASARADRFVREVQKVEPGKTLSLRVWGNGRYRDVNVTVQQASELPPGAGAPLFEFRRDGARGRLRINGNEIEIDGAGIERAMEEMGRRLQERLRDVELDVRDMRGLPERSGAIRIRTTRTAV
jgi:serine protease Do